MGRKKEILETAVDSSIVNVVTEKKKKKPNYLNNKDMLIELKKSLEKGAMTNTLAHMAVTLTKRYAKHPWFINYSYNDDMQSFALLTLVKFWNRFNPDKGSNVFAYFTQIIKNSFYQYKMQEKKHRNIRDLLLVEQGDLPSFTFMNEYDSDNYHFEKMDSFENDEKFKEFDKELSKIDNELLSEDNVVEVELEKELTTVNVEVEIPEITLE